MKTAIAILGSLLLGACTIPASALDWLDAVLAHANAAKAEICCIHETPSESAIHKAAP